MGRGELMAVGGLGAFYNVCLSVCVCVCVCVWFLRGELIAVGCLGAF